MGYKNNDRCLNKVTDDEPIFVLRAQDESAPALVRMWVAMNPQLPIERVKEALDHAEEMEKWPNRKKPD